MSAVIRRAITAHGVKVAGDMARAASQRPIFAAICERRGLPRPVFELRFAPPRRWAFDYAFPDAKVALEVEGGLWVRGAHVRGKHALSDMEKYNRATALGWKVFRCTPQTLCSSVTLTLLADAHPDPRTPEYKEPA